jgi:hypothetical protein
MIWIELEDRHSLACISRTISIPRTESTSAAPSQTGAGKLTLGEFALRRPTSFTTFSLRGSLDQVFDLRERSGLTQFAKIIAQFDVSTDTKAFARKAGLQQRQLLKTPHQLWKRLLIGPAEWRAEPQMSGIPAASQIFGRFVRDAGFDAVLYRSQ